jgi:cytochrome c peroxidase
MPLIVRCSTPPTVLFVRTIAATLVVAWLFAISVEGSSSLDDHLIATLKATGFTGRIESTLTARLGRPVDHRLADLGRLLFFDKITSLHSDNACAGCHSPTAAFGDTQSIAIGVQNNNLVGPNRRGPRNQRRTPSVVNAAFYPALMWNGRFFAASGDPFDNSAGFVFPPPEGTTAFPPGDATVATLLMAQAHLPPTELVESAGFTGTAGTIGPRFDQFDDARGDVVPLPDATGFRNQPIRDVVLRRLNESAEYRRLFASVFPDVAAGLPIDFFMVGRAIAEFEFSLTFADAPIDRFARGDRVAMSAVEKEGALLFFGEAGCVTCHAVAGAANEMFSDFSMHGIGIPQIAPTFGIGSGNVIFDGPGEDEDFGLEQVTSDAADRYKFRTSPLRNVAMQPAFFHNGSFTSLHDAIRHHLNVSESARRYTIPAAMVRAAGPMVIGPLERVLEQVDPALREPRFLDERQFRALEAFVGHALLDSRAERRHLCELMPETLPSGMPPLTFEQCPPRPLQGSRPVKAVAPPVLAKTTGIKKTLHQTSQS